ncbi:unnamed protein product [Amoebophrya sp. A25]|nr:unnamed protein product [Amoebophrya sp. A25]|eukprot:GSA25T00014108001.1
MSNSGKGVWQNANTLAIRGCGAYSGHHVSNSYRVAYTESGSRALKAWRPWLSLERAQWWHAMFPHWPPKDATPLMAIEPFGKQLFVHRVRSSKETQGLGDPRAPCQLDLRPDWVQEDHIRELGVTREDSRVWPSREKTADSIEGATFHKPRACSTYRERMDPTRIVLKDAEEVARFSALPSEITGEKMANDKAKKAHALDQRENLNIPLLCLTDYRRRVLGHMTREEWEDFRTAIPKLREQLHAFAVDTPPPSEDVDKIEKDQRVYVGVRRYKIASAKSCTITGYHGHRRVHVHPHAGFQRMLRRKGYIKKAHILGMTRGFEGRKVPTHPNQQAATYGHFREKALNTKMMPHGWLPRPNKTS